MSRGTQSTGRVREYVELGKVRGASASAPVMRWDAHHIDEIHVLRLDQPDDGSCWCRRRQAHARGAARRSNLERYLDCLLLVFARLDLESDARGASGGDLIDVRCGISHSEVHVDAQRGRRREWRECSRDRVS